MCKGGAQGRDVFARGSLGGGSLTWPTQQGAGGWYPRQMQGSGLRFCLLVEGSLVRFQSSRSRVSATGRQYLVSIRLRPSRLCKRPQQRCPIPPSARALAPAHTGPSCPQLLHPDSPGSTGARGGQGGGGWGGTGTWAASRSPWPSHLGQGLLLLWSARLWPNPTGPLLLRARAQICDSSTCCVALG